MQQTVKVPGDGQYVLDEGDPAAPPILLLHAGIADLTSWDTELRCPVLAVTGALDATEVPQAARHLAANAPNARAVMLPDVAHIVGMVAPDRLSRLVQEFLAQGRPGS